VTTLRNAAAVLAAAALLTAGCTADRATPQAAATSAGAVIEAGCHPRVQTDVLPEWARGGFSGDARATYAMGYAGQILGVLFGFPLSAPPDKDRNNKILWVASPSPGHEGADPDLVIVARLNGTGDPVERKVDGGPGPSIVDLPRAGCWRLSLSWGGRQDTMDLEYNPT
jgi:hypothetical protein